MVWYGMVRDVMVWYGIVWYGMVSYRIVSYGTVWYSDSCFECPYNTLIAMLFTEEIFLSLSEINALS